MLLAGGLIRNTVAEESWNEKAPAGEAFPAGASRLWGLETLSGVYTLPAPNPLVQFWADVDVA